MKLQSSNEEKELRTWYLGISTDTDRTHAQEMSAFSDDFKVEAHTREDAVRKIFEEPRYLAKLQNFMRTHKQIVVELVEVR